MTCCVPSCNNLFSKKSQNITFHRFPVDTFHRISWLSALGLEDNQVPKSALICSLHFNDAYFYDGKNGVRKLERCALPYVQVCLACLDTHSKLYPLSDRNLEEAYHTITGLTLQAVTYFKPALCAVCARRLLNCARFRQRSIKVQALLWEAISTNQLTVSHIESIRKSENLQSNLVTKSFQPNHCDLNIVCDKEEPIDIELQEEEKKTIVKVENHDTAIFKSYIEFENENATEVIDCFSLGKNDIKNDDFDIFDDNNDFSNDNCDLLNDGSKSETVADGNDKKNDDIEIVSENDSDIELIHFEKAKNKTLNDKSGEVLMKNTKKVNSKTAKMSKVNKGSVVKKKVGAKPKNTKNREVKTKSKSETKIKTKRNRDKSYLSMFELTKLSFDEQVQEIVRRKESANYNNSSFQCDLCYKGFLCENTFARHMEKHTKTYGDIECQVCRQHVKSESALSKHSKAMHSIKYNCTQCEFVTMSSESARMHQNWHKGVKYKCSHCEEEFLKYTTYITHLRVKHPTDCICPQCGYSYLNQKGLDSHMNRIHRFDRVENPKGPWCEECEVRFANDDAYHQHLKVAPKHYVPGTQPRNNVAAPARVYKKRAPPEYVSCEQCGIKLKDYTMYMYHFKREHPGEYQTKHAPRPRECLCDQCGRSFQTPFHLKVHMAKHTGKKEYQCEVCDKRFYTKRYIDIHKQTHSATRRTYACPVCGKTFTSQSSRNRHVWIHKEKSFKCDICDKAFSNSSERNSHVAHVHMKVPWPKRNRSAGGKARRGKSDYDGDVI